MFVEATGSRTSPRQRDTKNLPECARPRSQGSLKIRNTASLPYTGTFRVMESVTDIVLDDTVAPQFIDKLQVLEPQVRYACRAVAVQGMLLILSLQWYASNDPFDDFDALKSAYL